MNTEMLNALRDSYAKGVDIDSITESVLPPMEFVSDDPNACALEACSAVMEAYSDLSMYEAEANAILIESASTMSEYDIGVLSSAIQEGVGMRVRHTYQKLIVALKGMISKFNMFLTEKLNATIIKSTLKNIKKTPEKLSPLLFESVHMASVSLKGINDLIESSGNVMTAGNDMMTGDEDYKKFEEKLKQAAFTNDLYTMGSDSVGESEHEVDLNTFEKFCNNAINEIARAGKIFKDIISDRGKLVNELQAAENAETDKEKLKELTKTTNIKIKASGKILSAYGHVINLMLGKNGGYVMAMNVINNNKFKKSKKDSK